MPMTTTTTASSLIPAIYSAMTADAREENLLVWNTFDKKYEADLRGGGDRVRIQGVNNFPTGALALGVGGTLTYEAGSFPSSIILIVDTHAYHAFDLESEAELLSNVNLMEKLSGKSGYAVALYVDTQAATMVGGFTGNSQAVGTRAVALDEEDIRTAMRQLDDSIAPTSDRFMVLSPIQRAYLLGLERFTNALYKSAVGTITVNGALQRGGMGNYYGAETMWTGNLTGSNAAGHDNGMYHREAVAVAMLEDSRVMDFYNIDTDSNKRAVHSIFGLIEVRDNHGVLMRGL